MIRSGLGLSFGVVFSVLLFKRRAWPAFVGLGFGAGRAWEECDNVGSSRILHLLAGVINLINSHSSGRHHLLKTVCAFSDHEFRSMDS